MAIQARHVEEALDNSLFNLILFATEACNFRCTYCYEDFALGHMRPEVVQAVKKLISARADCGLRALEISWFGGEPLLAKGVVLDIGRHTMALARSKHFVYGANITTNGFFLTPPAVEELVASGVTRFQVSLDGPETEHDKTRIRRNGSGSFHHIWANLRKMRDTSLDFLVILRMHMHSRNASSLEELVDSIKIEFGHDDRFKVFFKAVEHLGGPNDNDFRILSGDERASAKSSLEERLSSPSQIFALKSPYICYAALPNSLAIRADGTVAKCTVGLKDSNNSIGVLSNDGTLQLDQQKLRYWLRGWGSLNEQELACPWRQA